LWRQPDEGLHSLVLGQGRSLGLHGGLALGVEHGLLLLLLQGTGARERLDPGQLPSLSLLTKAAQEAAKACLAGELLRTLLAVDVAEGLLACRKLPGRAKRCLTSLGAGCLTCLAETEQLLPELRVCAVELARLLPEQVAQLLTRRQGLLGALPEPCGQGLLGAKLLPGRGLEELAVALAGCQPLLGGRAAHPCKLLLRTETLCCGLAKLPGQALLGREALLCFGPELPGQGLLGPELLSASCPKASGLGGLCREALGFGLPEGRGQALLSPELLPGEAGQARGGCALCLTLARELAHGRLLGALEAACADPGQGLAETPPKRTLALSGR